MGIDVGLKYAVLSNGTVHENPKFLRQTENQLKKAQRKLSKLKRGSVNYLEQVQCVRQYHEKVANQRRDFLHKLSFNLSKEFSVIAVENLNIRHMVKNIRFIMLLNKFIKNMDGLETRLLQLGTATILLMPYVFFTEGFGILEVSSSSIPFILILGIVHTGIGFLLFFSVMKKFHCRRPFH